MTKFLIITATFLVIVSCNKPKRQLKSIANITFNIGFDYMPPNSGVYYDSILEKEVVYFGNFISKNEIKLFSIDGSLLQTIPLKQEVKNFLGNIDWVQVKNLDTIILSSNYDPKLCMIDRKGNIWNKKDFTQSVKDSIGNVYMILPITEKINAAKNTLLYGITIKEINNYEKYGNYNEDVGKKIAFYKAFKERAHYLEIINPYADTPKFRLFFYGFFNRLFPNPKDFPFEFTNLSDSFTFSNYANKVYTHNKMDILDSFIVKPEHTQLDFEPYDATNRSYQDLSDYLSITPKVKGMITSVLSDNEYKYIFVYHSLPEIVPNRPFSVLVYDRNNNKIIDQNMPEKYISGYQFMTSKGLYIAYIDSTNYDEEKKVFSVFDVQ